MTRTIPHRRTNQRTDPHPHSNLNEPTSHHGVQPKKKNKKQEGELLLTQLVEHYTHADKYKTLYQFNHEPKKFSFENYVRNAPRPVSKSESGGGSGSSPLIL